MPDRKPSPSRHKLHHGFAEESNPLDGAQPSARAPASKLYELGMVLYRRLCRIWTELKPESPLEDDEPEILERNPSTLGVTINRAFCALEARFPELEGLFGGIDFADQSSFPEHVLVRMLSPGVKSGESWQDSVPSILGDLIVRLAEDGGETNDNVAPPREVLRLLIDLLGIGKQMTVYDPACGSAEFLIAAAEWASEPSKGAEQRGVVGAERRLFAWARIKMYLRRREIDGVTIELRDTLAAPVPDRFDFVFCNPPFSYSDWDPKIWAANHPVESAKYGVPPRAYADFAFVLHVLGSLTQRGSALVLLPYGALFRGKEAAIRERLVREGVIEAIVRLGPKLFLSTDVPVAALILRRDRPQERRHALLVVEGAALRAADSFSEDSIDRIVRVVRDFVEEPGLSRVVTLSQLEQSGAKFKLNISPNTASERASKSKDGVQRLHPLLTSRRGGTGKRTNDAAVLAAMDALAAALEIRSRRAAELLSRGLRGASRPETGFEEFPRAWGLTRLRELGGEELLLGGVSVAKDRVGSGVLYLGQEDITVDGEVDFSATMRAQPSEKEIESRKLAPGDLLIIRVNSSPERCGQAGLVRSVPEPAVYKSGMWRIRIPSGTIAPRLLLHWLHHPPVRKLMDIDSTTSSRASIDKETLLELPCPLVEPSELRALVAELRHLDEAVAVAAATWRNAQRQK